MHRRRVLGWLASALTLPLTAGCRRTHAMSQDPSTGPSMPVLFVAHGAPPLLDDDEWKAQLAAWGAALPRPKAILVLSAHWEAKPVAVGATTTVPLVYDFYGFPARYYTVQYPAPGAPWLGARVHELLGARGITSVDQPTRGLDHGAYIPLLSMWPAADVPVLQVSLPSLVPGELASMGRALAPLREEGVLVMGSGFLTHNMRTFAEGVRATPSWAVEFDAWCKEVIERGELDALVDFERRAPGARLAHPRSEHFAPVIVAAAAAAERAGAARFPITGFWGLAPAFTKRSVQLG